MGLNSPVSVVCDRLAIEDFLKQHYHRNYKFAMADMHSYKMLNKRDMDGIKLSYSEKELSFTVKFNIRDTVDALDIFLGYVNFPRIPAEVTINDFNLNIRDITTRSVSSCLRDIHPFISEENSLCAVASNEEIFEEM
jgi:hypothetical protein